MTMNILPPRVAGPLSECNRSVVVTNAIPGSNVTIVVTRGGQDRSVGKGTAVNSKATIPLDPNEELVAGDLVNANQQLGADASGNSTDGPSVQQSVADFHNLQVLSHLYRCSRGMILGGMRPGTAVQILESGTIIGSAESVDGSAAVNIPNGLPPASAAPLIARQLICPKPPPPNPGLWAEDTPLPAVLPLRFSGGQTMPAPFVAEGLTACSRAVHVFALEPGAEIVLEGTDRGWWSWLGPSDQGSAWMPLPVPLKEGENVTARHEVAPTCEIKFERKALVVGKARQLDQPSLAQVPCNLTPTIRATGLKPESDVEFSVTTNGTEAIYRTVATETDGFLPAPPMADGSVVKVRQGECDLWSPWSATETAHGLTQAPAKPRISKHVFSCQDAIPIEGLSVKAGYVVVMTDNHGEVARVPVSDSSMLVDVAPSFSAPDNVYVEHHVCGFVARSDPQAVRSAPDVSGGSIRGPIYDGDGSLTVDGVTAGARIEILDATNGSEIIGARAPFDDSGRTSITFTGLTLFGGWNLYAETIHCGHYPRSNTVSVGFRAPALTSLVPASVLAGANAFSLTVKGHHFRSGAKVRWNGADRATTFVNGDELHAAITKADVASVKSLVVSVANPDGQTSGNLTFSVTTATPPPVGYDELLIHNCNSNTIPYSSVHRPIHIYYRLTGSGPGSWVPINDSPHDADYDSSGFCPSSPTAGARFAMDDGKTYDVACVDTYLAGCQTGSADEPACVRQSYVVHGKAGGGTFTVTVG
jgi:hypothetical protein